MYFISFQKKYNEELCKFYEGGNEAGFYTYHRTNLVKTRGKTVKQDIYIGFDKKGRPKRGKRVTANHVSAHLLKRSVTYPSYRSKPRKEERKKRRRKKKERSDEGRGKRIKKTPRNKGKRHRKKNTTS